MDFSISDNYSPYLIIGKLSRDFIITEDHRNVDDVPGGHLLYSAIGMNPWERHPRLVSRVGKNYPAEFTEQLAKHGFGTKGVRVLNQNIEHRRFICQSHDEDIYKPERDSRSVLSFYFHTGKTFPRELLGYTQPPKYVKDISQKTDDTIIARDIPADYLEARCVHLCPMSYLSHYLLPQAFGGDEKRTVTMEACSEYMQPIFFKEIKKLVRGLTAFIVKEEDLRCLFADHLRIREMSDMMKSVLDWGAEYAIAALQNGDYLLAEAGNGTVRRMRSSEVMNSRNTIGTLSCFCGAFVTGLNETYDLCAAAARGAARVSMLSDVGNPYHNLEVLEALANEKSNAFARLIS